MLMMCRVMTSNALAATFKLIHLCIPVDRKYFLAQRYLLEVKDWCFIFPKMEQIQERSRNLA
jgi:hypothetical protein